MLEARPLVAMSTAVAVGVWGLTAYPLAVDNPFLSLIRAHNPPVFTALAYGYATLWFTTPLLVASVITSLVGMLASRRRL